MKKMEENEIEYNSLNDSELEIKLKEIEAEFNSLKNAVATGLEQLDNLSNEHIEINEILLKRKRNGL